MSDRKALIAKIQALLAKTVKNGCTEAEAMSALEKARAMMADHDVDQDDLTFGGETCIDHSTTAKDRDRVRESLATAVGAFCECRAWTAGFERIVFFGLQSDTGFANWLLTTLADFVRRELENWLRATWKPGTPSVRRRETEGFVNGCTRRLSERLFALAPRPKPGNGRDLVVAKMALIEKEMAERGIRTRETFKLGRGDRDADDAGELAGDRARFNRPIDENAVRGRIGGRRS